MSKQVQQPALHVEKRINLDDDQENEIQPLHNMPETGDLSKNIIILPRGHAPESSYFGELSFKN